MFRFHQDLTFPEERCIIFLRNVPQSTRLYGFTAYISNYSKLISQVWDFVTESLGVSVDLKARLNVEIQYGFPEPLR